MDDGSTDKTNEILKDINNIRLVRQDNAGPAAARNLGASIAKGDIILFTDSDCIPNKDWIQKMTEPLFKDKNIVGTKGRYKTNQIEPIAKFTQLEYEDKYNKMKKRKYIDFIDTYSAGFLKEIFVKFDGYDNSFPVACAEDIELSYRISSKGYKMVFIPEAVVYHTHPNTFYDYLKKKYKFAYWRMLALKKNPQKVVNDSHTPQTMKIQLLLPPLILTSVLIYPFFNTGSIVFAGAIDTFFVTTIPFQLRLEKRT